MKQTFFTLIALLMATALQAQIRVVDIRDNIGVQAASVYDAHNNLLGLTNPKGLLPDTKGAKEIMVRHISYDVVKVKLGDVKDGMIKLTPREVPIDEFVVMAPKHTREKVDGYYRVYTSGGNDSVNTNVIEEGWVQWMLPLNSKDKTVSPKIMKVCKYEQRKDSNGESYEMHQKSDDTYNLLALFYLDLTTGSVRDRDWAKKLNFDADADTLQGQYWPQTFYKRMGDHSEFYQHDLLANNKDHTLSFTLLKLFGWNIDFHTALQASTYATDTTADKKNGKLYYSTLNFIGTANGGKYKKRYGGKEAELSIEIEIFYYGWQYMTDEEVKNEKKARKQQTFTIPPCAPPYDPSAEELIRKAKLNEKLKMKN